MRRAGRAGRKLHPSSLTEPTSATSIFLRRQEAGPVSYTDRQSNRSDHGRRSAGDTRAAIAARKAAEPTGSSDLILLARFIQIRDDTAFELLVWRHGAMVLTACRRILISHEDAEDAFQAVFLVLARKARGVARGAALPAWLHRVAVRIATRLALLSESNRSTHTEICRTFECRSRCPGRNARCSGSGSESTCPMLPTGGRALLPGRPHGRRSRRQLGCPTGTVESRLAAARKRACASG